MAVVKWVVQRTKGSVLLYDLFLNREEQQCTSGWATELYREMGILVHGDCCPAAALCGNITQNPSWYLMPVIVGVSTGVLCV